MDEGLLARCLDCLAEMNVPGTRHKNVFGMRGLMRGKKMFAAIGEDSIIVKVPPSEFERVLAMDGVERFMPGGQTLGYWVEIDSEQVADDPELREWLQRGLRGII